MSSTRPPDELDDIDVRLFAAYRAFADDHPVVLPAAAPLWSPVAPRPSGDRRRRALVAVAAAAVLVLVAGAVIRQRSTGPEVQVTPPASASEVQLPATPLRWFGFDLNQLPELSIWSAYTVTVPRRQPATFLAELHAGGDWQARPAASVVILDVPYGEVLPTATDAPAPGGAITRNGDVSTMVLALDAQRTLRIMAVGLEDESVRALGEQAPAVASGQGWSSLPSDLEVVQLRRDRIERAEAGSLTYVDRSPLDRQSGTNLMAIHFTADPVELAEDAVGRSAGGWRPAPVAGVDGLVLAPTTGRYGGRDALAWRDGARQFTARSNGSPIGKATVERWHQALRPLPAAEQDALVVGRDEVVPSAPGYASTLGYQLPPDAQPRIDTFRANLPAGIVALGGDGLAEDSVGVRGADPLSNNVVALALVPTTTSVRTANTDPWVVRDDGYSISIAWLSPSGWSYQMTAYSKESMRPPMSVDAMVALLRRVDAS